MFEGEKAIIFWIGLIILGFASLGLFSIIWFNAIDFYTPPVELQVPFIVGTVVFILIGLYMMKSGVKQKTEMQTTNKHESEEERKPENDLDNPTFVSRAGALLDFFSDRAVAHASFFVASIFGIVTLLTIIQQLDDNPFVLLSILLYFGFSYAGYFTLARFNYYANVAQRLSDYGLRKQETFEKIIISEKEGSLEDYMKQQSDDQVASLLPRKISAKSPEWYMRIIVAVYWISILLLGLIGYSKFWEYSSIEWRLWFGGLIFLVVIIVVVPPFYHHIRKK